MESFTVLLLDLLRSAETPWTWCHADTSINRDITEREHLSTRKVLRLLGQFVRSVRLAATGYDAYLPISQNRIGLIRDVVLLAPFRVARRHIVVHLHGGALHEVLEGEPALLRSTLRWLLGRDDARGIVVAEAHRRCLAPLLPSDRIDVVRNGADIPEWTRAKPAQPPLTILFMSTLMSSKGYRELVSAVIALADSGIPVRLELAGLAGTDEDERWITSVLHPAIVRKGLLEGRAKQQALQQAHVLVQPSTAAEGQPLSIVEGMGAGCAIVATRLPGIADNVGDEEGILVPARVGVELQSELENALRTLALSPDRTAAYGRAATDRYVRDFTPGRFFDSWRAAIDGCDGVGARA